MDRKDLEELNYKLADCLVLLHGFKIGILSNPSGNDKQKKALTDLVEWVDSSLRPCKHIVQRELTKEDTQ